MGQLTNQYVSQSYQGLLNLSNPFTGVTNTLQYVTDGLGGNTALQISATEVNVTGSFYINGVPITNGTSGTSGTSGQNGSSGTSGTSGQSGSSGTSGTSGVSGSSGTSGTSGQSGSSGTSGVDGSSGTSGTSGQNGSSGTSGTSGVDGSSGTSGTSGLDGSSGTSGTSGVDGSSGTSGTSGTSGDSIFAQTGSFWATTNNIQITGSLDVRSGSLSTISNNTTLNIDNFLTSSQGGQSNIIRGWGDNSPSVGPGATQANYTGSLRITGSNNIVSVPLIRPTFFGGGTDQEGYISGSDNIIGGNSSGIFLNTGSLLFPRTQGNILGNTSHIRMNFTTSSLSGGHPTIANNFVLGGSVILNSNSGSLSNVGQNAILGGLITSTQNFVTNTRPTIAGNNVIGNITLNHISSSINYQQNYNNAAVTVNNHLSSSAIANNSLTITNNAFLGSSTSAMSIFASGSQNTNATRNIINNLVGGTGNIVSSSFVSSSNSNLVSTIMYGNSLAVSASHTVGSNGGSAFFGRFNATGSNQEDAQSVVFAVGTGTAASNRKTGFLIDSGSNTRVSGSLNVIGGTNSFVVSGSGIITHSIAAQAALTVIAQGSGQPAVSITGSLDVSGSGIHSIVGNTLNVLGSTNITGSLNVTGSVTIADAGDLTMYGHKMFNVGTFYDTTTQSGSAAVSQSISYNTTDISQGVSVVSNSRLTVANAGTYNIQFSAQVLADTGADDVYIWLKKNGTNVADSAGVVYLSNNQEVITSWNYVVNAAANDYYELAWQSTNGDAVLLTEAAAGNVPSIPSVIVTVTQVR